MSNPKFDQLLDEKIRKLPRSEQPQRDLWTGIEMAIGREQQVTTKPYLAMAASIMLLSAVGWFTWQIKPMAPAAIDVATALSEQHQQQMQALLVSYQDQPALTSNWQQQLQELDLAASAIKKALQQEPESVVLLKMLQQVHQQQINVIEKVHSPKWQKI